MTQTQQTILQIIQEVYRSTYSPVSTVSVATRYGLCDRHMRRYLNDLKQTGAIQRIGQRGGWLPVLN